MIKECMKNDNGITLMALVITIIILLIISSTSLYISIDQIDKAELKGFYAKLEIAQTGVEKIYRTNENYKDNDGNIIYLKDIGDTLTVEQSNLINDLGYNAEDFTYFTAEKIEKDLGIHGVDLNLLINFEDCIIISEQGLEINGTIYYELEDQKYRVKYSGTKNVGEVDFNYSVEKYSESFYRMTIEPINIGDISQGIVKYKDNYSTYWKFAEDNRIILEELGEYYVMYVDANNNSIQKKLTLSLNEEGNIISTVEVVE